MLYINPFELLGIQSDDVPDSLTIKRAKRNLLADIELSDKLNTIYKGIELTKSDCIRVLDELDNKDKKEFHFFISKHKPLSNFLSNGDLNFYETYTYESIYKLPEFLDFISPFFTLQYDKQLSNNYSQGKIENLKLLLSINLLTNEGNKEYCFKSTYSIIKAIENEIIAINKDIDARRSVFLDNDFKGLSEQIRKKVNVPLLNTLPSYFQGLRNSLGLTIRNLARDINNEPYENYKSAYEIISIAQEISIDGLNKQTVSKGYYTIKKNHEDGLYKSPEVISPPPISIISEPSKAEKGKDKEKSNPTFKIFLALFCGLFIWAFYNSTVQTVILSASLLFFVFRIYNFIRHPEDLKNNKPVDILIFVCSVSACIAGFFYHPLAILYIAYNLVAWTNLLYCNVILNRPPKNEKGFGYLLIAVVLTLIVLSYQDSNHATLNASTNDSKTISTDSSNSLNSNNVNANNSPVDTLPAPPPKPSYDFANLENGNITGCTNINPKYNKNIDNKLIISCGSNADVAVKMINYITGKCIRYVYINKNTTYSIKNIPQGKYYLKIAYGNNWGVKESESLCEGRFTTDALYKKGSEILDYNFVYYGNKYKIPSFSLSLDVVTTENNDNTFNTDKIDENEFYNN